MSQLSSFIYFNNNVKLSKENLFDNILNFFNQTEHMTTLSVNGVREKVTLDIKFTINISKNCLIYGKRGSGSHIYVNHYVRHFSVVMTLIIMLLTMMIRFVI